MNFSDISQEYASRLMWIYSSPTKRGRSWMSKVLSDDGLSDVRKIDEDYAKTNRYHYHSKLGVNAPEVWHQSFKDRLQAHRGSSKSFIISELLVLLEISSRLLARYGTKNMYKDSEINPIYRFFVEVEKHISPEEIFREVKPLKLGATKDRFMIWALYFLGKDNIDKRFVELVVNSPFTPTVKSEMILPISQSPGKEFLYLFSAKSKSQIILLELARYMPIDQLPMIIGLTSGLSSEALERRLK